MHNLVCYCIIILVLNIRIRRLRLKLGLIWICMDMYFGLLRLLYGGYRQRRRNIQGGWLHFLISSIIWLAFICFILASVRGWSYWSWGKLLLSEQEEVEEGLNDFILIYFLSLYLWIYDSRNVLKIIGNWDS